MKYLTTFSITFLFFVLTFLIAKHKNKHDLIDIVWGMGFISSSLISLLIGKSISPQTLILNTLVMIWGFRLTTHIFKRNIGKKEDFRYVKYREEYKGKHFNLYFFFKMYLFQYLLNILISFMIVYSNINGIKDFTYLFFIGLMIWMVGFFFESVGDKQLKEFKSKPENKGKIMKTGLWQYTRHPNYFGEAVMWWGLYIISISNYNHYFLIFCPLTITILVRFVSGVPLLEKRYEGRKDWEEYKKETNVFFPFFKKN